MDPTFFKAPVEFRSWLDRNHESESELWVGFHKKHTGRPSLTWPESVDEALCFGWIDGIRKSIDAGSYTIRFTPRKKRSIWSKANTRRAGELIEAGLMRPAGLRAFEARDPERSGTYIFERDAPAVLPPEAESAFRANAPAWRYFQSQPPGYRATAIGWVTSAKREATRERRLAALIEDSASGRRVAPLRRSGQ